MEWIDAREQLPEKSSGPRSDWVLAFHRGSICIAAYYYNWPEWGSLNGLRVYNVTHWMPLPDPPKEVDDGMD